MANLTKSLFSNPALGLTLAGTVLLKNDERDYVDTAAVVAPLAYGGTYLYRNMKNPAKKTAANIFGAAKAAAGPTNNPVQQAIQHNATFNQTKKIFQDQGSSKHSVDSAVNAFMRGAKRSVRDQGKELESLRKMLYGNFLYDSDLEEYVQDFIKNPWKVVPNAPNKLFSKDQIRKMRKARNISKNFTERRKVVGHAFMAAMHDSSSPSDLVSLRTSRTLYEKAAFNKPGIKDTGIFTNMHIAEFSSVVDPNFLADFPAKDIYDLDLPEFNQVLNKVFSTLSDRPSFVTALKSKLMRAKSLKDPAGVLKSLYSYKFGKKGRGLEDIGQLAIDDPTALDHIPGGKETVKQFRRAINSRRINSAYVLSDINAKSGLAGSDILGIKVNYGPEKDEKNFFVPFKKYGLASGPNRNAFVVRDIINGSGNTIPLAQHVSKVLADNANIKIPDIVKEIQGVSYWQGLDSRLNNRDITSVGGYDTLQTTLSARVRNLSGVFSTLPIYDDGKGNQKGFFQLNAAQRTKLTTDQTSALKYLPLGSESGVYEGVLQDVMLEKLHPWWLHAMDKQESTYRALSKTMSLSSSTKQAGYFSNTDYDSLLGTNEIPEAPLHIANISPEDKALFANLPNNLKDFTDNEADIRDSFGITNDRAWNSLADRIRENYLEGGEALQHFGQLGETEYMLDPEFANKHKVKTSLSYELDSRVDTGNSSVKKGDVIGYNQYEPVVAQADGTITSNFETDGIFKMGIEHEMPLHGAKVDVNGVKGQSFATKHFGKMRDLINTLYHARGDNDYIPEGVNAIADMTYNVNKAGVAETQMSLLGNIFRDAFNQEGDTFKDIDKVTNSKGETESIFDYYNWDGNTISLNRTGIDDRTIRGRKIEEVFNLGQQVIENANQRVKQKIIERYNFNSNFFSGFAQSGSNNLEAWALKNFQPAHIRAWNHTSLYASKNLSLTYDMETFASLGGNFAAVKELKQRSKMFGGGDINQSISFVNHLINPQANPLNSSVSSATAFPISEGSLTDPDVRKGSIFDDSLETYKDNFTMTLPEGGRHSSVPVLGTGAYGGTTPRYGLEASQVRDYQRQIRKIAETSNAEERDALVDKLYEEYRDTLVSGKGSVLRPYRYDPDGVSGFLRTKTHENPFDVSIGPDVLATIKDSKLKAHLAQGGQTYGMMWRQPISDAMHVRVNYDKNLTGGHGIAASERLYRVLQGDADQDPVGISLWRKGTDAYDEAHTAIHSGKQLDNLDTFYALTGEGENSMLAKDSKLKGLAGRFKEYWDKATNINKTINNRTAGGSIGAFSNELSGIMESVAADSDIIRNVPQAARMKHLLFNFIRQVPISARKSHTSYDMQAALSDQEAIASAFSNPNEDTAFDKLHSTLLNLTDKFGKKDVTWSPRIADKLAEMGIEHKEGEFNPAHAYLSSDVGKQDIRDLLRSRTETSKLRAGILTGRGNISSAMKRISELGNIEDIGASLHGFASSQAARQQGQINSEIRNAAKSTKNALKDMSIAFKSSHGKAALIGLGAIAALGLMGSSGNRQSLAMTSNKYRPEDNIGVHDRVPGDPIIGSQSSNPPRNYIAPPEGVKTAVVAPLNSTTNTDIKMRAKDNNDSVEMAKAMSRMSSNGTQHVNVNYSSDPRIGTLRFRDHIRSMRAN